MVFENRVLRRIFRPKKDKVTGRCRKLRNDKFHKLYASTDIIRMITREYEMDKVCSKNEKRNKYKTWSESQEERDHWEDQNVNTIKINLREIEQCCIVWTDLAQDKI
jgi:ribosomal protein L28